MIQIEAHRYINMEQKEQRTLLRRNSETLQNKIREISTRARNMRAKGRDKEM